MSHHAASPGDAGLLQALAAAVGSKPQDGPFASLLPAAVRSPGAAVGDTLGSAREALLEGFDDSERQDLAIDLAAYAPSPAPAPAPAAGALGEQTPPAQPEHEELAEVCLAACGAGTAHPGLVDVLRRARVPRGLLVDWSYSGPRTCGGGAALDLSAAALRDVESESGLPSGPQLEAALRALLGGESCSAPGGSGGCAQVLLLRHLGLSGLQVGRDVFTYLLGAPERLGDYLRLTSLQLSACSLTDNDFKAFCSQMSYPLYKRLERLDLSHNPLGRRPGSNGWHGAEDVASMGPVWNEAPLRFIDLSFTELSSAALSYQLHRLWDCKPFGESPGTLACLEVLKVGPPGDMPELDDTTVGLLGAIIRKAPQLQALELFGLPEAERGVLKEKWREAKGEDACFTGPVGDAGAYRLSTLRLDELCKAEVAPTEHVLPGPVTPGAAAQVLQLEDEAEFMGQEQPWEEPVGQPDMRAAGAARAHWGLPPQRRQQRVRGQHADLDGELHDELAGGTRPAPQDQQGLHRWQQTFDAAAPRADGAMAGHKRKGQAGGGRRGLPTAVAGERGRAPQPAAGPRAAPSSGGGGRGPFWGSSGGAAGGLSHAGGSGTQRRGGVGSGRGGGGSSKPRAARAYGKEDELDYLLDGFGEAIDGEESPAAQSEEQEGEEVEGEHAVGSKRASQGDRLLKQGELAHDDVVGRRYRRRARELVERIPSKEDQKRARRALSNWDRMGDMPWDRKRWQNPIKGANEAVVVHLLCLVHFLAKHGMDLQFPIPDHVWESDGAPNGFCRDGHPPNGQQAQQGEQPEEDSSGQQQAEQQQQQGESSGHQQASDNVEEEHSSASGSDSEPEGPAAVGRTPRGGSTARRRHTQIIESDSEEEGAPSSSSPSSSSPGGSEVQRSKRQRGDGGSGGGCQPGPGVQHGDEGGEGGAGSGGGGGSSPEVHEGPMGSSGSQGAGGGGGSPPAETGGAGERSVPHHVPAAQADVPPPTVELQQRFRQQLGSVAASPLQQPDLGPESSGLPGQRLVLGVSSAAAEVEGNGGCPQAPASMRTELAPQQPAGSGEAGPVAAGAGAARAGAGGAGGKKVSSRIERELKLLQPWAWDGRKEQHPPNAEHYGPAEGKREHRTLLAPAEYVAAITDSQPQPIGLDALGSEWQPSPSQLTAGSPLGAHGGGSERRGEAEAGAEAAAGQRGSRGGGGGASGGGESSSDSEDDMPLAQLWAAKHAGSAGRGGSAAVHDAAASPAAAGRGPESTGPDAAAAGAAAAAAAAVAAAAAEPGVAIAAAVPAAGPDSAPAPTPSQPAAATGTAAAEAGAAASPPAALRPPVLAGPGASEVRSPVPQLGASVPGVAAAVEEEDAQQQQQQQQQQVEEEQGGEEVGEEAAIDLVSPAAAKLAGAAQGLGAGPEEGASGGGGGAPEVICIPDSEDQDDWGALPKL